MKLIGEILAYTAFATIVGLLSVWPRYTLIEDDQAIVSLAFSHAGERVGECKQLSQEEMDKLPPNMRKPSDCPRERHPIRLLLKSGDNELYSETLLPSGIWSDGKANVYQRVIIPVGQHAFFVGMNDSGGKQGFDFEHLQTVDAQPGRNIVVRFDGQSQQFKIR